MQLCITTEMHKPISQSIAEVEKCALLCNYYYENAETFLTTKNIKTEASESFVTYEPLGSNFRRNAMEFSLLASFPICSSNNNCWKYRCSKTCK
jgi:hypothetical protein